MGFLKYFLVAVAAVATFVVGILIGHFGIEKGSQETVPGWVADVFRDVDESLVEKFIAEVNNINIQDNLR